MEMPWSEDAEKGVLSAALIEPSQLTAAVEMLQGEEFFHKAHATIFRVMREAYSAGETIDIVTLSERLKTERALEGVGGYKFLATLLDFAPTSENIKSYASVVRDKYLTRRLIEAGHDIVSSAATDGGRDIGAVLEHAEKSIFDVSQATRLDSAVQMGDLMFGLFDEFDARMRGDHIPGLLTGYDQIDRMTSGLRNGQLVIVAGRPSMGKTAMALNIAANVAITHARPVGIFSLEMSKEELAERLVSSEARVDSQKLRIGDLQDEDFTRLATAAGHLKSSRIIVDDTPGLRPLELRAKARRLKAEHDIALLVVDYLQLMSSDNYSGNRVQEISEISRSLKTTAKELGIPVIALSQLSRKVEDRSPPRPILSDLRESGSIEQDADVVMFIYRPEFYFGDLHDGKDIRGVAEIIISKQRNGPTGMVRLKWNAPITRFE